MLVWSEKFATNIENIDNQHKKLFDLLNMLADILQKGRPKEEVIDETLNRLMDYASQHFMDEELLMVHRKVDPRLLSLQRMEHKSFIYDVNRLREGLFDSENTLEQLEQLDKLMRFVTVWLTYHTLGTDMDMAQQLKSIQAGISPEQAYEIEQAKKRDNVTTRLMLDAVLDMWRQTTKRCHELEKELAALRKSKVTTL